MARTIQAEAVVSAVDATGSTFENIAKKVKGLSSAMKSLRGISSSGVHNVNKTITRLQHTMHTLAPIAEGAGGAAGMSGIRGLIHQTVRATAEQAHEAVRMNVSGMSDQEIAEAEKLSGELSQRYRSLSQTTIMHSLRNMRAIVGTYEEAAKILDPVLKLRVAAQGAHPEHAEELAEDFDKLVKGMEIKGVTMDPEKFTSYLQGMAKAINVFGDTLRPTDYYEMFKYGRQSTQGLSQQFMLETAPTLAQELGGSSAGKAMSSFYQAIVGGRIKEQSVKELADLGLVNDDKVQRTTTGSIKGLLPGGVKGWEIASHNPYDWVNQVLLPALKAHGITSQEQIQATIGTIFQQGTAAQMASLFATQQGRIEKDWALVHGAKGLDAADQFQSKDPFIAWSGVTEQFRNLLAIAGGPLAEPAAAGLNAIASGLVALENVASKHPVASAATLAGTTAVGAGISGYYGYRGLRGIANMFGGSSGAADAAEVAAASGPTVLGTVAAGMARGGLYGGTLATLDAMKRDHDHSLRSYLRSMFGIQETDADRSAPSPWEVGGEWGNTAPTPGAPAPADKPAPFRAGVPMGTWAPLSAYGASMPAPEVKGSADLNVKVEVTPSDAFLSEIASTVRNEINVFGPPPGSGVGTTGSTGLSMPEVVAPQ